MLQPRDSRPALVLDTNVVLDLLVFRNLECLPLWSAIADRKVQWIATEAMHAEFSRVTANDRFGAWGANPFNVRSLWDRHCAMVAAPPLAGLHGRLRCTDRDDQMFIDLAVHQCARWLVSRDRAVLKLARKLHEQGVAAILPGHWTATLPFG